MSYLTPYRRPLRRQNLYTFQDAYVRVLEAMAVSSDGRHSRLARMAVEESWIELPGFHDWGYLYRTGGISTVLPYNTGTVAYTHSTYTLTLTGGTWPSDILQRLITINNQHYRAVSVTSSTVVVLDPAYNPGQDLDAGTEYSAYMTQYLIPPDFSRLGRLQSANNVEPVLIPPAQLDEQRRFFSTGGTPLYYTVRGSQAISGAYVIELCPAPETVEQYEFPYLAKPRVLRTWTVGTTAQCEYNVGTVVVSGTTVTGTGTAFTSDMVGCVIRFSDSATICPTGLIGGAYYGGTTVDNPYAEYRIVTSVTSATVLTVDEAPTGTYSGKKYTIGDAIDLPEEMWVLLLRLAEKKYVNLAPITERLSLKESQFRQALTLAQILDNKNERPVNFTNWVSIPFLMDHATYPT